MEEKKINLNFLESATIESQHGTMDCLGGFDYKAESEDAMLETDILDFSFLSKQKEKPSTICQIIY